MAARWNVATLIVLYCPTLVIFMTCCSFVRIDVTWKRKKIWSNEKRPKTRPIWPPRGSLLEGKSRTISGKPRLVKYYWIYLAGKLPLNHWCQEKAGLLPLGNFTKEYPEPVNKEPLWLIWLADTVCWLIMTRMILHVTCLTMFDSILKQHVQILLVLTTRKT